MLMDRKIIIYQIFTRLYGNRCTVRRENGTLAENGCGKMNDITDAGLERLRGMGVSHVWYTGIVRHATQTDYSAFGIPPCHPAVVKGRAGSPYAITDYYDIDPDLAVSVPDRMREFEALVARTHRAGLKVVMDFVPNHVARQYHSICKPMGVKNLGEDDIVDNGFDPRNNFYYCPGCAFAPRFSLEPADGGKAYEEYPAKATGNDHFDPWPGTNDWYETVKLNYGVDYYAGRVGHFDPIPDTWGKMLQILLFWASKGIDGFRCDMAEMVPAEFWKWAIGQVKAAHSEILFIGEVYNPGEYRNYIASGFDYLYDKVGMYDTMRAVTCGHAPASSITGAWQATDDIRDNMLYFLENHDEQRIASDCFAGNGLRGVPALVASVLMRRNPFMLYAGQEYGERGMDKEGFSGRDGRTTIFDYWSIDTLCRADSGNLTDEECRLYDIYNRVLRIAAAEKSVCDGGFFDLMYVNPHSADFNPNSQYAFLRATKDERLLVVVNFAENDAEVGVVIPAHAFETLGIAEKNYKAAELLTGGGQTLKLKKDTAVKLAVGGLGACVLKF